MAPWVMPLYIFSGIIMAIGAYLTIRYRPYCTLKSPEREIAMELYLKTLRNESMHIEEEKRYRGFKKETSLFTNGMRILLISTSIHIVTLIGSGLLWSMPIYGISIFLMLPIHKYYFDPFCFSWVLRPSKAFIIDRIDICLKQSRSKFLHDDELKEYKSEMNNQKEFYVVSNLLKLGVITNLIFDIWFSISYTLVEFF